MAETLGAIVPLVAAFTDDTSTLSEVRVARLVRFHLERGARGFLVGGETGDPFQLAHSERKQLLEWVLREGEGANVWVNITAMTTSGVVDLCQHASRHGAKGAVVCPPPAGRFFAHEAKALLTAINRHGNLQTLFADPHGVWESFELPLARAETVDSSRAVFERPCPDEMKAGGLTTTPFAMFGADKLDSVFGRLDVFLPAMKSVVRHGGINRVTRAALIELGCDVGPARSPQFELGDEGRKILLGMLRVLGG